MMFGLLRPFLQHSPTSKQAPSLTMPKRGSDALYKLITSLDRNEKGYVKRYCSRHMIGEEIEYLRLFDALESMDRYSDEVLKEKLAGTDILRRLSAVKNHLYQQILEAMRAYHASKSTEREIMELFLDADFLWEKALYDQAMKRITKAKELARSHDEYTFWLKAISWEKNYRGIVMQRPDGSATQDTLSDEQTHVLSLARNTVDYEELGNLLQFNLIRRSAGDHSGDEWLRNLPQHPLLQSPSTAIARPAQFNFHLILSNWYGFAGGDPQRSFEHAQHLLELVDRDTELSRARPDLELGILHTFMQRAIDAGRIDQYLLHADRLWDPEGGKPTRNIDVKRFYRAMTTELGFAVVTGDRTRVMERLSYLKERFKALYDQIPDQSRISASFLAARICVDGGQLREAGVWLRHVFSEDDAVRTDLHIAARLLQLRMAADDGDNAAIRSTVRSLTRLASNRTMRSARLDATLSYFRRLADARLPRERTKLREELIAKLGAHIAPSPFDAVRSAGIEAWLGAASPTKATAVESSLNY
ncbi:MAG TPA: hypothetical protein VK147_06430 [Candidatus Didemnitutus sp.]|nr:hypothetical protein [Candidatus Didemnitutus sp.]